MFKRLLPVAAVLLLSVSPALAGHCPKDVKAIDAAMASSKASPEMMAKARALRDSGAALHKAGKHGESLKALHEALALLGVKHH